jgi:hypothetical protein
MKYLEMKNKHQDRINALPLQFAFNKQQFEEGMRNLGLSPDETDKVCSIPAGGFILKTDRELVLTAFKETNEEMSDALANDDDFCIEALIYEMGNHEYGYTMDPDDTLASLGLSLEDERTNRLFKIAQQQYFDSL